VAVGEEVLTVSTVSLSAAIQEATWAYFMKPWIYEEYGVTQEQVEQRKAGKLRALAGK
jgi:hypothetical protein